MKHTRSKIQKMSRILKVIFMVTACALPILDAGFWITSGYPFLKPWLSWDAIPHMRDMVMLPLSEMDVRIKFLGFLAGLIPTSIAMAACLMLAKVFHLFEHLEFFSPSTVKVIRKIGFCLLFNQLIYPLYTALLSLILTISNPPGQRMICAAFGTTQINLTVIAMMVILISWIMEEGRKIHEEHAATI